MDANGPGLVTILTLVLGAGGLGAFVREIAMGIGKLSSGMAGRESRRKIDIVQQRDEALTREAEQRARADDADVSRRRVAEYASALRRQLIENGLTPGAWPVDEKTIPAVELKQLRGKRNKE